MSLTTNSRKKKSLKRIKMEMIEKLKRLGDSKVENKASGIFVSRSIIDELLADAVKA
jgi:hypothetical protein